MRAHLAALLLLTLLPLALFARQTLGGRTLLPSENLYQYEPYASDRAAAGAPERPHNHLLSDLVLQNMQWRAFVQRQAQARELPLWNPHQLGGVPFLAAGQPSVLYPPSVLLVALALWRAYGWYAVLHLALAGAFTYGLARALGARWAGALIAGVAFQLCGFLVAGAVFPMMQAGAAWLPLVLWMIVLAARRQPLGGQPATPVWAALGAGALGLNVLAGHVEVTYYTLLVAAAFCTMWVAHGAWTQRATPGAARGWAGRAGWLLALGVGGLALGAAQLLPLVDVVQGNFRAGGAGFAQVLAWAHPPRDVLMFALPNLFGSPAQHSVIDAWTLARVPVTADAFGNAIACACTDWGIKNYVEGALYVGLLPLALALYGAWDAFAARRARRGQPPVRAFLVGLVLLGGSFMFGLPTYALLYYGAPGLAQSHTPFRWVYPVSLALALLAACGWSAFVDRAAARHPSRRLLSGALLLAGALAWATVIGVRAAWPHAQSLFEAALLRLALAANAFPDARTFASHVLLQLAVFGTVSLAAGALLLLASRGGRAVGVAGLLAALLTGADLIAAYSHVNPASDPALLDYVPPSLAWLRERAAFDADDPWRYLTLQDPALPPLLQANLTWRYGLDDLRGYESIIPRTTVDALAALYPQVQLAFNRIAPLYTTYDHVGLDFDPRTALTSDRLHLLNVRYIISHASTDIGAVPGYTLDYEDDAVRVWRNSRALPRASLAPDAVCGAAGHDVAAADGVLPPAALPVRVLSDTGRTLTLQLPPSTPFLGSSWLIISQFYADGWRAYLQTPQPDGTMTETALPVAPVQTHLLGVRLDAPTDGGLPANATIRLVYSPRVVLVGLFSSGLAGLLAVLTVGIWAWRAFVVRPSADGAARLARNTSAPVLLNLFNRGINFAFALVMLRILGPTDTGVYYYAALLFVWFDIFTNYGLDVYVLRDVARDPASSGRAFVNATALRLLLSVLGLLPLALVLLARQTLVAPPFPAYGVAALLLLYMGLLPGSISKGLTALYYAHERAEVPAVVGTASAVAQALLGLSVLLAGWGIVGLAAASILTNLLTLAVLAWGARGMGLGSALRTRWTPDAPTLRRMSADSWPLMLNHFLATIFFQIDVVLLEALQGATIVGQYSVAYRWLLALNIIPAFFTQALMPHFSRRATTDRAALRADATLALKLLAAVALPLAVAFTVLAYPLVRVLGGAAFLPAGAIALGWMIWSIPLGWLNSLIQYLLIALDLQRRITWAFFIGVTFNIVANLLLIPRYSYVAAAITTILSELVLLAGFGWLLARRGMALPLGGIMVRPALAAAVMCATWVAAWRWVHPAAGLVVGPAAYVITLVALRPLNADEWARVAPRLPARLTRWWPSTPPPPALDDVVR